jgi:two-component system, LytTR family, sensor histidine kinase AlgZ
MHPILQDRWRLFTYLAAWELLGFLFALLIVLSGAFSWSEALALAVPLSALYGLVCLGAFWVCWAAPLSGSLLRVAASHLLAAVICASLLLEGARGWAGLLARTDYFGPGLTRHASAIAPLLLGLGLVLYLFAAALHYMLIAFERSRYAETEALQAQILSREAELRALRAQIQPHFLFNSLNSINALVGSRPEEARRVCVLLADFLRRTLVVGTRERVPLSEELTLVEDLLSIERVRFGDRLRYECSVEEGMREWQVPPLVLQPLVENAVTHGIAQCLDGGAVVLTARRKGDRLHVTIENPRDADAPRRPGTGIGLENVRRRLETTYGRAAEMRARPDPGTFRVELEIPAEVEAG